MASYGLWYDNAQTVAHFNDHVKSIIIYNLDAAWENELLTLTLPNHNTYVNGFWLAAKLLTHFIYHH